MTSQPYEEYEFQHPVIVPVQEIWFEEISAPPEAPATRLINEVLRPGRIPPYQSYYDGWLMPLHDLPPFADALLDLWHYENREMGELEILGGIVFNDASQTVFQEFGGKGFPTAVELLKGMLDQPQRQTTLRYAPDGDRFVSLSMQGDILRFEIKPVSARRVRRCFYLPWAPLATQCEAALAEISEFAHFITDRCEEVAPDLIDRKSLLYWYGIKSTEPKDG